MKTIRHLKRLTILVSGCLLVFTLACCANFQKNRGADGGGSAGDWNEGSGAVPLPQRNENVSFAGPGSSSVNRELFPPVYFAFDSPRISPNEFGKIDNVARVLTSEPKGTLIIAGFTDSVGTAEYNRQLGEYRALSIRNELIRRGIQPGRIQTVSFGEDLPAVAGDSPGAHAANRRAEFGIVR